jgi:hypothetical protein
MPPRIQPVNPLRIAKPFDDPEFVAERSTTAFALCHTSNPAQPG